MKPRVVLIGGGMSGLIASYVFRRLQAEVLVIESGALGGEFLAGGLKYIHHTIGMINLFDELGVVYSDYAISGGIMLRGGVHPYPKYLHSLPGSEAARIRADHYRKTRRTEADAESAATAMNDPAAAKPRKAIRAHFPEVITKLAGGLMVMKTAVTGIRGGALQTASGVSVPYDYCVVTIPLWAVRRMADFYVPEGVAMKLNVIQVHPLRDRYVQWDYVYTPYTPADAVHRFSPSGSGYSVEINGQLDVPRMHSDLNFIFQDGWAIDQVTEGLKGHLLPLEVEPEWPNNIAPLGRFATWNSRSTMDVVLEDAIDLAERWFDVRPMG